MNTDKKKDKPNGLKDNIALICVYLCPSVVNFSYLSIVN